MGDKMQETLTMTKDELQKMIADGIAEWSKSNATKKSKPVEVAPVVGDKTVVSIRRAVSNAPYRAVVIWGKRGYRVMDLRSYQKAQQHGTFLGTKLKSEKRGVFAEAVA